MAKCDLCGQEASKLIPMCSREDCVTKKEICKTCLKEAYLKYIVLMGEPGLIRETEETLRHVLMVLRKERTSLDLHSTVEPG